ncbi:MAG: hypothetical protein H8E66_26400 [Planctomycetes bacterium]|nr:hypothetical protein [Planctomycetota bacterium]
MAIETICKGCARKLRVGDEFAGRKGRCPHCKTIYDVPEADRTASHEQSSTTNDAWLLRTKDGGVYGPAPKSELDGWVKEGRLDSASQLRKDGEETWRPATDLYPSLIPAAGMNANPFVTDSSGTTSATNPYSPPAAVSPTGRIVRPAGSAYRPHRGGLILTFGLLGFICCQIFSIVAWVMGHADMKEINAGRMDPAGRGLTQAGMIIGIVGTVLLILVTGAQLIIGAFAILNEM